MPSSQAKNIPGFEASRALDTMSLGILIAASVLFLPGIGLTPFGDLGMVVVLPIWMTAAASYRLRRAVVRAGAGGCSKRLVYAGVLLAGFSPFLPWWTRDGDSLYLALNAGASIAAGIWFQLELLQFVRLTADHAGITGLVEMAKRAQTLVTFCLIVPVAAFLLSFVLSIAVNSTTVLADLRESWQTLPGAFRLVLVVPVVNVVRVLWTAHRLLLYHGCFDGDEQDES